MTSIERLLLEIAGGVLLCGALIGWWNLHNHSEQKIGATACIQSTTEVKAEVVQSDTKLTAQNTRQLQEVVTAYESKLADAASVNAAIAKRLHDYALRQGAAAGARCPAGEAGADAGLPDSQGQAAAGLGRLADDTKAVLDACDADHAKVSELTSAYNDWRQSALDLQH